MESGTWLKFFNDGTLERGSDVDIDKGLASWSKGRQDNIKSVHLEHNFNTCCLSLPNTQWYQYDRYMAMLGQAGNNVSKRTGRVIQAQIKQEHVGKTLSSMVSKGITVANLDDTPSENGILISQKHVGLWVTMYILVNNQIGITICEKGAFYGDKQILK